ncbi:MAG: diguanylate cyclase domain-containing protein, partial [Desulfovibrionales bacterium]
LFSKALEPEKSGQDSFQFEVPLDDLQEAYVMSLDFQHVQGGIPGITETMSRHLRWTFDLREWELGIRKPGSARWIFSRIENGQVATTRELESLHDIPWSEGGVEFKLLAGGNLFGELRIPRSGITPLVEKKINLYVRLASFGLQHYFQNLAVVEGKAKTLELLPLAVAIMDDAGFIQDANAEMHRFLQQEESLVGERFWPLLVKSRGAQMDANWKTFLKDKKIPFYNRVIFALAPVESAHQPSFYLTVHRRVEGGMQVMVEDISGVSHLEVEAIRQREYLQNLLSSMQDLVLTLERDGTISFASSRSEQLVGRNFFTIAKPMGIFINVWGPSVLDSHEGPLQVSIQVGDSEAKPMEMMISKLQSVAGSYMAVGRDLSIILRLEEKIKRQAIYDHLTNIFNRHQFQLFLNKEIDRCHREGRKLGLIFFDVDGLKVLNDKQGHAAGDAMLKELGRILREGFRKGLDFPCRYGGDEFVVLLTGITSGKILHILGERLLEAVHDQFKGTVGLSVGLAILKDKETAEDLINRVDRATYQAKVQGGNRIIWAE